MSNTLNEDILNDIVQKLESIVDGKSITCPHCNNLKREAEYSKYLLLHQQKNNNAILNELNKIRLENLQLKLQLLNTKNSL